MVGLPDTKWGGVEANSFARAAAARTESAKASTRAGQLAVVDVNVFTQWLAAFSEEHRTANGEVAISDTTYVPDPMALSGFLYERFRAEFKPAFDAWAALRPTQNAEAPPTPFAMKQYVLADQVRADRLDREADRKAAIARRANQRGGNYVLATVLFAAVLFFAGISSKFERVRNRTALLVVGVAILATYPVDV